MRRSRMRTAASSPTKPSLYARERDLGLEAQNYAAEIKIRAERKLGALLAEMPKHPPGPDRSDDVIDLPPKLADLGISKNQSSQWQQIASIPEPEFERHIAVAKAEERPLTTSRVVDLARNGFDPSTLPPKELSRAERAYFGATKALQWLDIAPAEVAAPRARVRGE